MEDSPEISGLLYKKRGGFGKMMPNAWQFRFFTVINGILSYYDTDMPEININDNKARGRIDMKSKKVEMYTNSSLEGSPTTYTIVLIPQNEEKWKLCAATKEDQFRWCHVLEKYAESLVVVPSGTASTGFKPSTYHVDDETGMTLAPVPPVTIVGTDSQSQVTSRILDERAHLIRDKKAGKKRLKSGNKAELISNDALEYIMALISLNSCLAMIVLTKLDFMKVVYLIIANYVVGYTIYLRGQRCIVQAQITAELAEKIVEESAANSTSNEKKSKDIIIASNNQAVSGQTTAISLPTGQSSPPRPTAITAVRGKPLAGSSFKEVNIPQLQAPNHTWCKCDHRIFNVRIGPNYDRYKKKAPSPPPLYDVFAVDVFCTKRRLDNASERFQLPDTSHINTHHASVPPIFVIQLQMPADPPASLFTTVEDGPGWAIMMYFMITEDTCNQLKNLETASGAVKLLAEYCSKAPDDPAWKARFKVICSCSNLEELGVPQMIASYNAKPVLIRRTGSLFRGPNYIEKDIHIYKFANLAKQSIHYLSSRCGLMYMQIGFVIEGKSDSELPETLLGCLAANKPQEDSAEFLFDDV